MLIGSSREWFCGPSSSPMMMETGEQMKARSAIRRLRDAVKVVLKLCRILWAHCCGRRARSKPGERIDEAGHEESKPAK